MPAFSGSGPAASAVQENQRADLRSRVQVIPEVHRMLPHSPEAELGALCSFLLAPHEVGNYCGEHRIGADSFHAPTRGDIFGVLIAMYEQGAAIDIVTLTQALRDRELLEKVGGPAAITDLFVYLPTASNFPYYFEIIQEKHTLRRIIQICNQFSFRSYEEGQSVQTLLDEVEKEIFTVAQDRYKAKTVQMKEHVMTAINAIQDLYQRRGAITGLSTGLEALDKQTDGLHGAEMFVIAARPSMGKTALAMNIAEHIAVELKKPVAVFSLEMSAQQLVQRLLCSCGRVNLTNIRDGFLSERDMKSMTDAATKLSSAKIFIDDTASISILELRAKARRMKSQHGIEAIFIDYLQLLRSTSRRAQDNRQIEIAEISSGIKALAKELDLPIVVLAQLNRNPEQRAGDSKGRPRLSDLRESGSIEQDADVVGLLVRDEYYADTEEQKEEVKGKATLIIAKQRNGPTGDVKLTFLEKFTRFETRASDSAED